MKPFGAPRPLRSQDLSAAVKGPQLTDADILTYILKGHYGEQRRLAALANMPRKRTKRKAKSTPPNLALDLLS